MIVLDHLDDFFSSFFKLTLEPLTKAGYILLTKRGGAFDLKFLCFVTVQRKQCVSKLDDFEFFKELFSLAQLKLNFWRYMAFTGQWQNVCVTKPRGLVPTSINPTDAHSFLTLPLESHTTMFLCCKSIILCLAEATHCPSLHRAGQWRRTGCW